jgi:two-component system sensor histidine kinase BaeS
MLDRLWSRFWLSVFLATAIPLAAFILLGVILIQHSVENADVRATGRQARTLRAVLADQTSTQRVATQAAVATVGRKLSIYSLNAIDGQLPDDAVASLRETGYAAGRVGSPDGFIFGAARLGDQVVVLQRPYETPVLDWGDWLSRLLLGGLIAATCAIVASLLLARTIARPVDRVVTASNALARGETPQPLPLEGPRELRSLSASFNTMSTELVRAHDAERRFLLSISHELRTPVAAVQGFAESIREDVIDSRRAAAFILAESRRLERLIGDLLDLARLRAGRFDVLPGPVDLRRVARDAAQRTSAAAESLDTDVVVLASQDSPAFADPDRVLQITSNLVENALRVSPPGSVVSVETGPGFVRVVDNGPGLDPEELEQAFQEYILHDRRKEEGGRTGAAGLGLALVRELAETMGGSVEAAPAAGGGSVFTVRLPLSAGDDCRAGSSVARRSATARTGSRR